MKEKSCKCDAQMKVACLTQKRVAVPAGRQLLRVPDADRQVISIGFSNCAEILLGL